MVQNCKSVFFLSQNKKSVTDTFDQVSLPYLINRSSCTRPVDNTTKINYLTSMHLVFSSPWAMKSNSPIKGFEFLKAINQASSTCSSSKDVHLKSIY